MDPKLFATTLILGLGLSIIITLTLRDSIMASWDESRCKPGVIATAALFKPKTDTRTGSEFATENWHFCQKQYIETSLKTATVGLKNLSESQGGLVSITSALVDGMTKTFTSLWSMCYQAYAMFMERFNSAAKLLRNMMINMYALIDRLQGITFSIAMALVSMITAMINTVQVTLMVAVIIIGIILVLQILLFYLFAPISGLILTVSTLVMVTAVVVTTAITASMINDACFTGDTQVATAFGPQPIRDIKVGDILIDGARVEATHVFKRYGTMYDLNGIKVSGDHLVYNPRLIPVRKHPNAGVIISSEEYVYCLTTTTRRIHVLSNQGMMMFADWEEIPENDPVLDIWYSRVFEMLNGFSGGVPVHSDAGFSPDCMIQRHDKKVKASDLKIGDHLMDGVITGIVHLEGYLGPKQISNGTWMYDNENDTWIQYYSVNSVKSPLIHFYMSRGILSIGNTQIRDASEIGLHRISQLVDELILNRPLG